MTSLADAKHIHLVGIGGIGLSAIARVLLARGYRVSGSDVATNALTEELHGAGVDIFNKHRAENLSADTDLVVVTSAASDENLEVRAAHTRGIRVVKRREFLEELTAGHRVIGVAGSHGKTTTTALLGLMLAEAGLDPTVIVGGIVPEFGSNARTGQGKYFVIEADEYDRAFLGLTPSIAVITNVDYDHPDIFPTRTDYQQAFVEFARRAETLVVCGDDAGANAIAEQVGVRVIRYGLNDANDWRATNIHPNSRGGNDFQIAHAAQVRDLSMCVPGQHNVLNALGAWVAAERVGVEFDLARAVIEKYRGAGRRFEVRGEFGGVAIVDDYAHHPSEIRATLAAAREQFGSRKIWAVFQPHTYSRTRALLDGFAAAFDAADGVIVTEIYAAREQDTLGLSGMDIVARMKHREAQFIPTLDQVVDYLTKKISSGDVVITLGAGDVNRVGQRLAELRDAKS